MIARGWKPRGSCALLVPKACSLIPSSLLDQLCLSQLSCKIKHQSKVHDKEMCLEVNLEGKLCFTGKFILQTEFQGFNLCFLLCFQAAFTFLLGPFTFFNVQKTKYLQIMTSLMRWIGESWPLLYLATITVQDILVWKQVLVKKTSLRIVLINLWGKGFLF